MDPIEAFKKECEDRIRSYREDRELISLSHKWVKKSWSEKYSYNFKWLGRPIIQLPQDVLAMQEIIWEVQPELIIETGIAHGGSLIFYASMLELLGGEGTVLGIDIDIREHNRREIEKHPMFKRIRMVQGSSRAPEVVEETRRFANNGKRTIVCLDSCHTRDHVLEEMRIYSEFVTIGSYLVVFDTIVEDLAGAKGSKDDFGTNNPKAAVRAFLCENKDFEVVDRWNYGLLITHNPDGFLRRIK
jgi:cephalosporin hydroxylase